MAVFGSAAVDGDVIGVAAFTLRDQGHDRDVAGAEGREHDAERVLAFGDGPVRRRVLGGRRIGTRQDEDRGAAKVTCDSECPAGRHRAGLGGNDTAAGMTALRLGMGQGDTGGEGQDRGGGDEGHSGSGRES